MLIEQVGEDATKKLGIDLSGNLTTQNLESKIASLPVDAILKIQEVIKNNQQND